jgi:Flp pilus assembly protein TadG
MTKFTAKKLRSMLHREDGQAGFEFLLILPAFFLFFLLLIDFGVTMYDYVSVANAVREGSRLGAVNCGDGSCTSSEIKTRVLDRSGGVLSAAGDVSVSWPTGGARGSSVAVKVTHNHTFIFFPYTWTITACSDMRLEQTDSGVAAASGSGC